MDLGVNLLVTILATVAVIKLLPRADRAWERVSAARAAGNTAKARRGRAEATFYIENPDLLTHRLLRDILSVVAVGVALLSVFVLVNAILWLRGTEPIDAIVETVGALVADVVSGAAFGFVLARVQLDVSLYRWIRTTRKELGLPVFVPPEGQEAQDDAEGDAGQGQWR